MVKNFLLLTWGILSAQTYKRLISLIYPYKINKICIEFSNILTEINKKEVDHFNLKIYRGSSRKNSKINPLNVLNIFSSKYGYVWNDKWLKKKEVK